MPALTLPDGRLLAYPEQDTPEKALSVARTMFPELYAAQEAHDAKRGLMPAFLSGLQSSWGSGLKGLGAWTGSENLEKRGDISLAEAQKRFEPTTEEDVNRKWSEGVVPGGLAQLQKWLEEPTKMAGSIAGPVATTLAVAPFLPEASAGAGLAWLLARAAPYAVNVASFAPSATGALLHEAEQNKQERDVLKATTYGLLDAVIFSLPFGATAIPKQILNALGADAEKIALDMIKKGVSKEEAVAALSGNLKNMLRATAINAATAVPAMTASTALHRDFADKDLVSPEALQEYGESAKTALELAPFFGVAHGAFTRGSLKSKVEEAHARKEQAAYEAQVKAAEALKNDPAYIQEQLAGFSAKIDPLNQKLQEIDSLLSGKDETPEVRALVKAAKKNLYKELNGYKEAYNTWAERLAGTPEGGTLAATLRPEADPNAAVDRLLAERKAAVEAKKNETPPTGAPPDPTLMQARVEELEKGIAAHEQKLADSKSLLKEGADDTKPMVRAARNKLRYALRKMKDEHAELTAKLKAPEAKVEDPVAALDTLLEERKVAEEKAQAEIAAAEKAATDADTQKRVERMQAQAKEETKEPLQPTTRIGKKSPLAEAVDNGVITPEVKEALGLRLGAPPGEKPTTEEPFPIPEGMSKVALRRLSEFVPEDTSHDLGVPAHAADALPVLKKRMETLENNVAKGRNKEESARQLEEIRRLHERATQTLGEAKAGELATRLLGNVEETLKAKAAPPAVSVEPTESRAATERKAQEHKQAADEALDKLTDAVEETRRGEHQNDPGAVRQRMEALRDKYLSSIAKEGAYNRQLEGGRPITPEELAAAHGEAKKKLDHLIEDSFNIREKAPVTTPMRSALVPVVRAKLQDLIERTEVARRRAALRATQAELDKRAAVAEQLKRTDLSGKQINALRNLAHEMERNAPERRHTALLEKLKARLERLNESGRVGPEDAVDFGMKRGRARVNPETGKPEISEYEALKLHLSQPRAALGRTEQGPGPTARKAPPGTKATEGLATVKKGEGAPGPIVESRKGSARPAPDKKTGMWLGVERARLLQEKRKLELEAHGLPEKTRAEIRKAQEALDEDASKEQKEAIAREKKEAMRERLGVIAESLKGVEDQLGNLYAGVTQRRTRATTAEAPKAGSYTETKEALRRTVERRKAAGKYVVVTHDDAVKALMEEREALQEKKERAKNEARKAELQDEINEHTRLIEERQKEAHPTKTVAELRAEKEQKAKQEQVAEALVTAELRAEKKELPSSKMERSVRKHGAIEAARNKEGPGQTAFGKGAVASNEASSMLRAQRVRALSKEEKDEISVEASSRRRDADQKEDALLKDRLARAELARDEAQESLGSAEDITPLKMKQLEEKLKGLDAEVAGIKDAQKALHRRMTKGTDEFAEAARFYENEVFNERVRVNPTEEPRTPEQKREDEIALAATKKVPGKAYAAEQRAAENIATQTFSPLPNEALTGLQKKKASRTAAHKTRADTEQAREASAAANKAEAQQKARTAETTRVDTVLEKGRTTAEVTEHGLPEKEGRAVYETVIDNLPEGLKGSVHYYQTVEEVPERYRHAFVQDPTRPAALFRDGNIVAVGERHFSAVDLEKSYAHELIGHVGVEKALGEKGLKALEKRLFVASEPEKGETRTPKQKQELEDEAVNDLAEKLGIAAEVQTQRDAAKMEAALEKMSPAQARAYERQQVTRELLAHAAEKLPEKARKGQKETQGQFFGEAVRVFRKWISALGLKRLAKVEPKEIFAILRSAEKAYKEGQYALGEGDYLTQADKVGVDASRLRPSKAFHPDLKDAAETLFSTRPLVKKLHDFALGFRHMALDNLAEWGNLTERTDPYSIGKGFAVMNALRQQQHMQQWSAASASHGYLEIQPDGTVKSTGKSSLRGVIEHVMKADKKFGNADDKNLAFALYVTAKKVKWAGLDKLDFKGKITQKQLDMAEREGDADPEFRAALKENDEYNAGQIRFLRDAGYISPAKADEFIKRGSHISWYRVDGDGDIRMFLDERTSINIGNMKKQPYLHELVGSDMGIQDYVTSSMRNTQLLTNMALSNMSAARSAHYLRDLGMSSKSGTGVPPKKFAGPATIQWHEAGERHWLLIDTENTPFADINPRLLAYGLDGIRNATSPTLRLLQAPANILRKSVTRMPLYVLRQLWRDPLAAAMNTGADITPLHALKEFVKIAAGKSKEFENLQRSGAVGGHVYTGSLADARRLAIMQATYGTGMEKIVGKGAGIFAYLDHLAIAADAATRVLIYKDSLKKGLSHAQAVLRSQESMNFYRHGSSSALYTMGKLTPFFNAAIQGMDVQYRALRGKMPFNKQMEVRKKLLTRGMLLAGTSIAYAAAMADDPAYKTASANERYGNWFVRMPGFDEPLRLPVMFEPGYLFKSLPEMIYNTTMGKERWQDAGKAFGGMLLQTVPGGNSLGIPQVIKPLMESYFGKDIYTGSDIESARLKSLPPEMRYTARTTEVSKALGSMMGLSPVQLDHLVNGYFSTAGLLVLGLANPLLKGKEGPVEQHAHEMPLVGGLFQSNIGSGPIDSAFAIATKFEQAQRGLNKMKEEGASEEELQKYAKENAKRILAAPLASAFKKDVSHLYAMERQLRALPEKDKSPRAKQELIDKLSNIRTSMAQKALEKFRAVE